MASRLQRYYYGSYGLLRGYGPLHRNMRDAEESVYADHRAQRAEGSSSDRHLVLVTRVTGLCWWLDDVEINEDDLMPVRDLDGKQAQYELDAIRHQEGLWGTPEEQAGFG